MWKQAETGSGLTSDWSRRWREIFKANCNDLVWWTVELSTVDPFSLWMDHCLLKGERGGGEAISKNKLLNRKKKTGKGIHEKK